MSYMDTKFCNICDEDYNWAAPECPGCVRRRYDEAQAKEIVALKAEAAKLRAEVERLKQRIAELEASLQGCGAGMMALEHVLGPTPNGIVAAVSELRAEVERLRRDRDSYANSNFEGQLSEARAEAERLERELTLNQETLRLACERIEKAEKLRNMALRGAELVEGNTVIAIVAWLRLQGTAAGDVYAQKIEAGAWKEDT